MVTSLRFCATSAVAEVGKSPRPRSPALAGNGFLPPLGLMAEPVGTGITVSSIAWPAIPGFRLISGAQPL